MHHITIGDLLRHFAAEGLAATFYDMPRPNQTPKITGDLEAHLITLCCSGPPEGRSRWTLRLLANRIVAQDHLDNISHVAVRDQLKNDLKPWQVKSWCLTKPSAKFVAKREDVLEVYQRPYNPTRPVICLDEKNKELPTTPYGILPAEPRTAAEPRTELEPGTPRPGKPRREDYEYERNGTRNLFLWIEPLSGKRQSCVTERRTALDFAQQLKSLVTAYPAAEQVVLVTDNLNTHTTACLYEAFAPDEARRITGQDRAAPYARTRQLAEHELAEDGGDGTLGLVSPMLEPPDRGCGDFGSGSSRLAGATQPSSVTDPLAVYDGGCSDQVTPNVCLLL